jgi:hypothetical protein
MPLWLPIVLSAVVVWIVATMAWVVLPHHKKDYIGLDDENGFMEYVKRSGIEPGNYLFPDFRDPQVMKSERIDKVMKEGPVGHLSVWPTPLSMGSKMVTTFFVYLAVSILIAYLTRVAIPGAASFGRVFQVAATAGILAYSFSSIPNAIWFGSYKRTIVATLVDGVLFGAIIGAIFAWRWPH